MALCDSLFLLKSRAYIGEGHDTSLELADESCTDDSCMFLVGAHHDMLCARWVHEGVHELCRMLQIYIVTVQPPFAGGWSRAFTLNAT